MRFDGFGFSFSNTICAGEDRGPVLEVVVARMNYMRAAMREYKVRVVGLSTALANAGDLALWLGIESVRTVTGNLCKLMCGVDYSKDCTTSVRAFDLCHALFM